ncbi:MAG: D-tyrosyl-tRNA(Tyr) deacylase [Lachnospiraceae bacterium]|nr:D-tyrosyl-tRNA(Tyr) deacylase [Lachnospiraceae bacterium]
MRLLVQRVKSASVTTEGRVIGSIGKGYLVFQGVCGTDTETVADKMLAKLVKLRIFEDENGKTNLSLGDVGGAVLFVSQFTLYADCRKGNRPSFTDAGDPIHAESIYKYSVKALREQYGLTVETGEFGADMQVSLVNDGPFTVFLDSPALNIEP